MSFDAQVDKAWQGKTAKELADALVEAYWGVYGDHPASAVVVDLGFDRETLARAVGDVARRLIAGAHDSGDLERLLRDRLAPFYDSPAVAAILAD